MVDKRKIFNFIRIFVSLALLSFLIYRNRGNFEGILNTLKNLDITFLILGIILYSAGISFIVFRWGILLQAHGYRIFRPFLWQSAFIGWFYNMLLPTGVGGDFYRVYDLYKNKGVPMDKNISAAVIERIIGTITGIMLLLLAYFLGTFDYLTRNTVVGLLTAMGIIIAFFIVLFLPRVFKIDLLIRKIKFLAKVRPKLRDFHNMLTSYRYKKRYVLVSICYSFLIQVIFITSYHFVGVSMGLGLSYKAMVFTLPFAQIASSAPIAIGGMGLRENAAAFALESFGISTGDATLFSFIILSIILFNALLGGLVYVLKSIFYKSRGFI